MSTYLDEMTEVAQQLIEAAAHPLKSDINLADLARRILHWRMEAGRYERFLSPPVSMLRGARDQPGDDFCDGVIAAAHGDSRSNVVWLPRQINSSGDQ